MWDGMGLEGGSFLVHSDCQGLKKVGLATFAWQSPGPASCDHPQGKLRGKKEDLGHWGSPGSHAGGSQETWSQGFWLEILALES